MLDEELNRSEEVPPEDVESRQTNNTVSSNWMPNPDFEYRLERCLDIIRGGAGHVAEHLDIALRSAPKLEDVCPLLKKIHFPKLSANGFNTPVYNTLENRPALDGSVPMYFSAAKDQVFRCLCQYTVIPQDSARTQVMA